MEYFVTGATGFIGKRLVRKLLDRPGSTVHFLTRSGEPEKLDALYAFWGVDASRAIPVVGDLKGKQLGVAKARGSWINTLILSLLAGAFIALGAQFFTIVTTDTGLGYGLTRVIGGLAFSLGLFLVIVAGAELFTGNNLIIMAWASRRISSLHLVRNWGLVYAGNFAGALATVVLVYASRQWEFAGSGVGANALRIADSKVDLGFIQAVALGMLCNGLVCLAVWLAYSARSNTDKFLAVLFPITAFVASGFEHSIANMYFIPIGLLLKEEDGVVNSAGLSDSDLSNLTAGDFLLGNLLPVTIGNIIGGAVLVGAIYWFIYLRPGARHL
jgi:formate/nitrite transporter